eukprot:695403-Rhodomonas_salina.3
MHLHDLLSSQSPWRDDTVRVEKGVVAVVFENSFVHSKDPLDLEAVDVARWSGVVPAKKHPLQSSVRLGIVHCD